jgi:hypothetical protein
VIVKNSTPVLCGSSFELKLLDPICHQSSAVVFWIANAMSSMNYRNIELFFLDGVSSVGGVEDEFGGFVSVCLDPFWFRDEVKERVGEQGKT